MNGGFRITRMAVERLYSLRALVAPPLDGIDHLVRAVRGRQDFPPLSARQLVSGRFWAPTEEFDAVGRAEARSWHEVIGLEPQHTVLDIGCGCGRVARHVLPRLPDGAYVGADVDARAVAWCERHLRTRHPRARFLHIDAYNSIYNPRSRQRASEYRFPLADGSVDRITLSSVFTHMLPEDVDHYLDEMARMLRPGGRAYVGAFLLNAERRGGSSGAVVGAKFPLDRGDHAITSEKYPDLEVAYREDVFTAMAERRGLRLAEPVRWGTWAGNPGYRPLDIVALVRP